MSYLTDNPDVMAEALAILVKRAGGTVTIPFTESPGPYNLLSKFDADKLHLVYEDLSLAELNAVPLSDRSDIGNA